MMFGAGGAPAPAAPPPPGNKNQTMMFGTPASNAAAAPPPPANSGGKQTMVFGLNATAPAAPAPPPGNKNQTMMFGTPAANAAPPPAAPAAPTSAKQTMVFGASPFAQQQAPQAPPPGNKNQTMMFGTPAANAAPPPAAPVPAAPPPGGKNQTMMFGTAASSAPPPPAPPAAPTNARSTMMFGTPASNAAPPPAAPAPQPSAKQTMVFGTAAANASQPAPPPTSSARTTMMFGGGVTAPPPAPPPKPTFGTAASNATLEDTPGEETILEQPGQSSRTVLFGTAAPAEPAPAAAKNQTMMFGKSPVIPKISAGTVELAGMSADEEAPNESTVRVDAQAVVEEQSADEQPQEPPARQERTQRFAMTDLGGGPTPPEGRDPVQDRHNRTQLFAMSSAQESTAPSASQFDPGRVGDTTLPGGSGQSQQALQAAPTIDLTSTLPPDQPMPVLDAEAEPAGVSVLHDPANQTPMEALAAPEDGPISTTMPNLSAVIPPHRQLPPLNLVSPEPGGSPSDFNMAPVDPTPAALAQEDAAAMRAARGGGGGRAVVIVLAIIALALTAVLIYRLFGDQIMGAVKPAPQPVGAVVETRSSRLS